MRLCARSLLAATAMVCAAGLFSAPASAQLQLEGFWNLEFNETPDPVLLNKLPQGTVVIKDTGVVEFEEGDFGGLTLTPQAAENARNWKREDDMTISRVCVPPSIIYALQGPFPFEVYQTKDVLIFKYEYYDAIRTIFMDGRAHPPENVPHTKSGFSTGRWEGDELVIETSHIAASTITNNGLDHSDNIRMIERYRLDDGGKRLRATQWFTDPDTLVTDGARYIEWVRQDAHIVPYECDPSFALEYGQIGQNSAE